MPKFGDARLPDRFWQKVQPCPMSGCWLWTGSLSAGYGRASVAGVLVLAHRLAYEALVGPVPAGLNLDHRCRVPCCCNPLHLDPVTHAENVRRGLAGAHQAAKTHCPAGHEYTEDNVYITKRGCRTCRECGRISNRRRYHAAL